MLSLYLHIPFCAHKCSYCNFFMLPLDSDHSKVNDILDKYTENLMKEIGFYHDIFGKTQIRTIYFGGGTPLSIGKDNIIKIIDKIKECFDLEYLEEISFELNPHPYDEVMDFVDSINKRYKDFYRIRFSFGIQTFDDDLLKLSNRDYFFNYLTVFLRDLQKHKTSNNIFNFDFIAFGKFNQNKKGEQILWDNLRIDFLKKFVSSLFADSFSLYTLELFAGSHWRNNPKIEINQDSIYQEFEALKNVLIENGYSRYEISNFALRGKNSLHNQMYRDMGDYVGLGTGAHSYVSGENMNKFCEKMKLDKKDNVGLRFEDNLDFKKFLSGDFVNLDKINFLDSNDVLIEKFFLGMRTQRGIDDISKYKKVLVNDFDEKIKNLEQDGFVMIEGQRLFLTDRGMDVYNDIIISLIKEF